MVFPVTDEVSGARRGSATAQRPGAHGYKYNGCPRITLGITPVALVNKVIRWHEGVEETCQWLCHGALVAGDTVQQGPCRGWML